MKIHIVKKGDTLYELSKKYGVPLDDLIKMNPQIPDPDELEIGMKVKIPSGAKSVVKAAEKEELTKKQEWIKEKPKEKETAVKPEVHKENVMKEKAKEAEKTVKKETEKAAPKEAAKEKAKEAAETKQSHEKADKDEQVQLHKSVEDENLFAPWNTPAQPVYSFYDLPKIPEMEEEHEEESDAWEHESWENKEWENEEWENKAWGNEEISPSSEKDAAWKPVSGYPGLDKKPFGSAAVPAPENVFPQSKQNISAPVSWSSPGMALPAANPGYPQAPFAYGPTAFGGFPANMKPYPSPPAMTGGAYSPYAQAPVHSQMPPWSSWSGAPATPYMYPPQPGQLTYPAPSAPPSAVKGTQQPAAKKGASFREEEPEEKETDWDEETPYRSKKGSGTARRKSGKSRRKKRRKPVNHWGRTTKGDSLPWINM